MCIEYHSRFCLKCRGARGSRKPWDKTENFKVDDRQPTGRRHEQDASRENRRRLSRCCWVEATAERTKRNLEVGQAGKFGGC